MEGLKWPMQPMMASEIGWGPFLGNGKPKRHRNKAKTLEGHVADAENLARGNNGVLPSASWLQENGWPTLYVRMLESPERFAHIPRAKHFKSIEDHVADDERVAKDNGGVLPLFGWLYKNGYYGLYQYMNRNPERFAHIPRHTRNGIVGGGKNT